MKMIVVNGSPNPQGNTATLLQAVVDELEKNQVTVQWLQAAELIASARHPFCTACSTPCSAVCYKGTNLEQAFDDISQADAVIFGSPVYFGTVSGQLKAFFDKTRKIRGQKAWLGLPASAVTTGASRFGGQETTVRALHDMMLVQGMTVLGDGHIEHDCGHFGASAQRPVDQDQDGLLRAKILAKRMMEAARQYKQRK
ncbi:flavodoxin family protein [Heliorestis convoluta]|uniref:NADPH-dependent FMN reductase n=1 Tax=Heliorestis convoluta TaxID=356322 RepID=A0A5Q2MYI6_9FIRM|nr:flavodoxin family protein [Heliorestis convoluta]QGG47788.1 NADPH-dependent FMN reductase [Heliorestis convoluta]